VGRRRGGLWEWGVLVLWDVGTAVERFRWWGGGGGGALTSCVDGEEDEAAVLRETPRRLEISSFVSPLDSRKAIFRSVEASRISSSCRNREACSRRAALDGGDASFGGSSGLRSGSLRSCGWLWRCHDGIDAFF